MTSCVLYIFVFMIAALGACLGSFLNVVIWRVPEKMSLITPPSHCPKCGARVRWFDNIPIASWFLLRAKCRDCKEPISGRYPFVEGVSFALAFVLASAFLLGGWTGGKSEWFHWEEYSNYMSSWGASLGVHSFSNERGAFIDDERTDSSGRTSIQNDDAPYIVDFFLRVLFATSLLSVVFTAAIDTILVLGFVEYDRGSSPTSLVFAAATASIIALVLVVWLTRVDLELSCCERLLSATKSALCGLIGSCLFCKWIPRRERIEAIVVGACAGIWLPPVIAFCGVASLCLISLALRRRVRRNYFGLLIFFLIFGRFAVETARVFIA